MINIRLFHTRFSCGITIVFISSSGDKQPVDFGRIYSSWRRTLIAVSETFLYVRRRVFESFFFSYSRRKGRIIKIKQNRYTYVSPKYQLISRAVRTANGVIALKRDRNEYGRERRKMQISRKKNNKPNRKRERNFLRTYFSARWRMDAMKASPFTNARFYAACIRSIKVIRVLD